MADEDTIERPEYTVLKASTEDELTDKLNQVSAHGFQVVQITAAQQTCWVIMRRIVVVPKPKPVRTREGSESTLTPG